MQLEDVHTGEKESLCFFMGSSNLPDLQVILYQIPHNEFKKGSFSQLLKHGTCQLRQSQMNTLLSFVQVGPA